MRQKQSGSAIIMLFIAVALFGALAYAFMQGSRTSTSMMTSEASQAEATSSQMQSTLVTSAVQRLKLKGCKPTEISFETPNGNDINPDAPADGRCHVYKANGGGISYRGTDIKATSKTVFATSTYYTGDLGGSTGADSKCMERASAANLIGNFKAWISTSTSSPFTTFIKSNVPYKRVDGTTIANNWADLTDGSLLAPINITELGGLSTNTPRTGTAIDGTLNTYTTNCDNFTSSNAATQSLNGNQSATSTSWTVQQYGSCGGQMTIYCFEQ